MYIYLTHSQPILTIIFFLVQIREFYFFFMHAPMLRDCSAFEGSVLLHLPENVHIALC